MWTVIKIKKKKNENKSEDAYLVFVGCNASQDEQICHPQAQKGKSSGFQKPQWHMPWKAAARSWGLWPRAGTLMVCYVVMLVTCACISHWTTSPWRAACSTHWDSVSLPCNMTNTFSTLFLWGFIRWLQMAKPTEMLAVLDQLFPSLNNKSVGVKIPERPSACSSCREQDGAVANSVTPGTSASLPSLSFLARTVRMGGADVLAGVTIT